MVKKLTLSPSPAPEKSTFAQTCNLLSQYLKAGKANLGDISLAAKFDHQQHPVNFKSSSAAAPTTTLDLLPGIGSSSNREAETSELYDGKPLPAELLPPFAEYGSTTTGGGGGAAQMTIFYDGKVIVFNDFSAEKAKEIMGLVSEQQGIRNNNSRDEQINNNTAAPAASSSSTSPHAGQRISHLRPPQPRAMGSDLPIARRASLHRFMEKRKDRVTSRGPYHHLQSPKHADANNNNNNNNNPWLDGQMSQSAKQLELSL